MTSRRRRRLAAWLLVGWAMFWFITVIQPCSNLPAPQGNADQRVAIQIGSDAMWNANLHGGAPMDDDGSCQTMSAVPITLPNTASVSNYYTDSWFVVSHTASAAPAPRHAGVVIAHAASASPLSGAPAYLRHQRLLI